MVNNVTYSWWIVFTLYMSMIDNIKYSPILDLHKVSGIRKHQCSYNIIIVDEISHFVHHINSFWNKKRKVLKFWKFDEKRAITPK